MLSKPAYPIFVHLAGSAVLVVGGGNVALRKVLGLVEAGAAVTVVSPEFHAELLKIKGIGRIKAAYAARHMGQQRWRLVFAATDIAAVNEQVARDAAGANILCCRCDEPDLGDFAGGASTAISTGKGSAPILLAVNTQGASPLVAVRVCREAAAGVDPLLATLAGLMAGWRVQIKQSIADAAVRSALLKRCAGEELEEILKVRGTAAQKTFRQWLAAAKTSTKKPKVPRHAH